MQLVLFFLHLLKKQLVLTADGVGEWATTTVAVGKGNNRLEIKKGNSLPTFTWSSYTQHLLITLDLK
jgi:predicted NodU family carbamoyl transferase